MGRFIDADGKQYYFEPGKEGSLTAPYNKKADPLTPNQPVSKTIGPTPNTPPMCPDCGSTKRAKVIVGSIRG
jgi:hypothetical protein